jgi:hypothetical protein
MSYQRQWYVLSWAFVNEELNSNETSVDPLLGFAFLQTFISILREYFGDLSAATLKDNFDVVYQVRNLFLRPSSHEPYILSF